MKNILIPIDFSDVSWNALYCALCFFKDIPTQFYILHINTTPINEIVNEQELVIHKNIATHQKLENWLLRIHTYAKPHHRISTIERKGNFIKILKEEIVNTHTDLIILGTQQTNVFEDSIVGSYTREVITRVKCPTIIVPQDVPCPVPKQIALVTDFNFKHNPKALEAISQIVTIANAHLTILNLIKQEGYTDTNQKENKSLLKSAFSDLEHSFHFVVNQTMDEALQFFIDVHEVDLVILFAKNMNFSEHLLFTPSADTSINYHKRTPFLIVHE